jgi:hypothetical protein
MASVYRVTAIWSGFQGAPGYSKFSFQDLTTAAAQNAAGAQIRTFFDTLKVYMKTTWSVTVQPTIQEYDMATGDIIGEASMSSVPVAVSGGAAGGSWPGGSGYCVSWKSNLFFNGRKVQGRTFMVPAVDCFEGDGTLSAGAVSAIQGAGAALIAAPGAEFCLWAKTFTDTTPRVQNGGAVVPVTACVVKDAASQLRSRRN